MAVRQSGSQVGPSATFNLATQVGNTLVAILTASPTNIGSVTLNDSKGNSVTGARKVNYSTGGITSITIWVLENIANAGASHTLSCSGVDLPDFCTFTIAEVSLAPASSYDSAVTATARDTDGSPYTLTTGTPSQGGDLIFGVLTSEGSTALDYSASGWTRIHQNGDFTTYWGQAVFTKSAGTTAETLSATATGGAATQLLAAVGIKQLSFPVVQPFEQKTASVGDSVTFSPSYTGSPTSYQWKRNGSIISGATSSSYTVSTVTAVDNGAVFSVVATNSLGSSVEVGTPLFVRDLNTGKGRGMRGWMYQRHQLGITTPVIVQDRDDWGAAAFDDWVSLSAPSLATRYVPGGDTFDPNIFDPAIFDAVPLAQQLDSVAQSATVAGSGASLSITATQTLDGVTQTATAAAAAALVAAQTLAGVTQAATAATTATAAATQTLAGVTQTATASAGAAVAATQTLAGVSQTATATAVDQLAAAQTLAGVTQTATATSAFGVIAAQTLAGVTQAATLAAGEAAAATQTLAGVTQTATAVGVPALSATQTLAGVTQTATATVSTVLNIVAAQTLAGVTQASTAVARVVATATQTLDGVTQSATAIHALASAAAAQTLAAVSQTATAQATVKATATQTLDNVTQTATGTSPPLSGIFASQQLAGVTQTATATETVKAAATQQLLGVVSTATAAVLEKLQAAQTLAGVSQSAAADHGQLSLDAAQTLAGVSQTATAIGIKGITGAQVLDGVVQTATAVRISGFSGLQVLDNVVQLALVRHELSIETNARTYLVRAEDREVDGVHHEDRRYGIIAQLRDYIPADQSRMYDNAAP